MGVDHVASPESVMRNLYELKVSALDFGIYRLRMYLSNMMDAIKLMDHDVIGVYADYDKDKDRILIRLIKDYGKVSNSGDEAERDCKLSFSFIKKIFLVDAVESGDRKHSFVADLFNHYSRDGDVVVSDAENIDRMVVLQRVSKNWTCEAKLIGDKEMLVSKNI